MGEVVTHPGLVRDLPVPSAGVGERPSLPWSDTGSSSPECGCGGEAVTHPDLVRDLPVQSASVGKRLSLTLMGDLLAQRAGTGERPSLTLMGNLLVAVDDPDLVQGANVGRQAAVHAQHLVLDYLARKGTSVTVMSSSGIATIQANTAMIREPKRHSKKTKLSIFQ